MIGWNCSYKHEQMVSVNKAIKIAMLSKIDVVHSRNAKNTHTLPKPEKQKGDRNHRLDLMIALYLSLRSL